jgi:threonine/homoserine/homoserine lactone efflux protein
LNELIGLIAFSFVASVTPGPNNVLLWASGATFGLRRTVPHILGSAVGIGAMALAVAAGLGALITAMPSIAVLMKVAGSAYLLYLAWQVLRASSFGPGSVARPFGLLGAASFQWVNPKAWIFAIGAITTFRPADLPVVTGSLLVTVTMMAVIVPSATIWAAGGGLLGRLAKDERARRAISVILATLLVATIASVWL